MENNTLKTGIDGLDVVLNCKDKGLVLNKDNNLLIVLRGDRGISKLDLAMKMMEGISLSTPEQSEKLSPPRFYTLNKDWKELRGRSSQSMKNRYKIEEVIPEIMTEGEDKERRKTSYLSSRLVHFNVILQKIKDITIKGYPRYYQIKEIKTFENPIKQYLEDHYTDKEFNSKVYAPFVPLLDQIILKLGL